MGEEDEAVLESIWDELWENLHHQGDVDIASYATVPQIARICIERGLMDPNAFGLVATIEECRLFRDNPSLPDWLETDYQIAIKELAIFGAQKFSEGWSPGLTSAFLSVAAFAKESPNTGRMLITFDEDEINEAYEAVFGESEEDED
ncbi:MAG TPA: hypothetical protein VFB72_04200 [Verrucomicrobiae bacterium]|nr:hypothetical protein [Verrucomicrobiae bacterium]